MKNVELNQERKCWLAAFYVLNYPANYHYVVVFKEEPTPNQEGVYDLKDNKEKVVAVIGCMQFNEYFLTDCLVNYKILAEIREVREEKLRGIWSETGELLGRNPIQTFNIDSILRIRQESTLEGMIVKCADQKGEMV